MHSAILQTRDGQRLLEPGMRLTQAEFHRRYEQYPDDTKFELIGGVVYMASPQKRPHGRYQALVSGLFWEYEKATPGVEYLIGSTVLLSEEDEPQPDLTLRIVHGGESQITPGEYLEGPPELLTEVSHASEPLDLGKKRQAYEQAGVAEYLVILVERREVRWFHFPSGETIAPNRRGIAKSRIFPGLWLHVEALLALESALLSAALQRGLASREHQAFVRRLARQQPS